MPHIKNHILRSIQTQHSVTTAQKEIQKHLHKTTWLGRHNETEQILDEFIARTQQLHQPTFRHEISGA